MRDLTLGRWIATSMLLLPYHDIIELVWQGRGLGPLVCIGSRRLAGFTASATGVGRVVCVHFLHRGSRATKLNRFLGFRNWVTCV